MVKTYIKGETLDSLPGHLEATCMRCYCRINNRTHWSDLRERSHSRLIGRTTWSDFHENRSSKLTRLTPSSNLHERVTIDVLVEHLEVVCMIEVTLDCLVVHLKWHKWELSFQIWLAENLDATFMGKGNFGWIAKHLGRTCMRKVPLAVLAEHREATCMKGIAVDRLKNAGNNLNEISYSRLIIKIHGTTCMRGVILVWLENHLKAIYWRVDTLHWLAERLETICMINAKGF